MRDNHQVRDFGSVIIPQIPPWFSQRLEDNMLVIIIDNNVGHNLCLAIDMVTIEVPQQLSGDIVREDGVKTILSEASGEITFVKRNVLAEEHRLFFLTPNTLILLEGRRDGGGLRGLVGEHYYVK